MANWMIDDSVLYVLWKWTHPRIMGAHWGSEIGSDLTTINSDLLPPGESIKDGGNFKAYITHPDVNNTHPDLLKGLKTSQNDAGEPGYIDPNMDILLSDKIKNDFVLTNKGIIFPIPDRPQDPRSIFNAYYDGVVEEGILSINIPGLTTIPTSALLEGEARIDFDPITPFIELLNDPPPGGVNPADVLTRLSSAVSAIVDHYDWNDITWWLEGKHFYGIKLLLPRIVARAWVNETDTSYAALNIDTFRDRHLKEYLRELVPEGRLNPSVKALGTDPNQDRVIISDEGLTLPALPPYPTEIKGLFDSWAKGEAHVPTYSNSGANTS